MKKIHIPCSILKRYNDEQTVDVRLTGTGQFVQTDIRNLVIEDVDISKEPDKVEEIRLTNPRRVETSAVATDDDTKKIPDENSTTTETTLATTESVTELKPPKVPRTPKTVKTRVTRTK